ncbi:MAG: response regulator transcription factor [Pseudomonadota bacterium]
MPAAEAPIRVLIVEDEAITRDAIARKVDQIDGFQVTASAETLSSAQLALAAAPVDVLLCDLALPDGDGTSVMSYALARYPDIRILVISILGDERRVLGAIEAGAHGYLLKDDSMEEMEAVLKQLLAGGSPLSPQIARHLIRRFQPQAVTPTTVEDGHTVAAPEVSLSEREAEVLRLAAKGFSYQETADLLGVSINTIGTYTKRVYAKLAVRSRSEAVFEASRLGLMDDGRRSS